MSATVDPSILAELVEQRAELERLNAELTHVLNRAQALYSRIDDAGLRPYGGDEVPGFFEWASTIRDCDLDYVFAADRKKVAS